MPNGEANLQRLHGNLSEKWEGFNMPYEVFKADMENEENLKKLHENLSAKWEGFNMPYDSFKADMTIVSSQKKKQDEQKSTVEEGLVSDSVTTQNTEPLPFVSPTGSEGVSDSPSQDLQAQRVRDIRPTSRKNPDGSESTVLMGSSDNIAYPTLFPKDPSNVTPNPEDWIELPHDEAIKEAEKRGEIFEFDTNQEANDFASGSWKATLDTPSVTTNVPFASFMDDKAIREQGAEYPFKRPIAISVDEAQSIYRAFQGADVTPENWKDKYKEFTGLNVDALPEVQQEELKNQVLGLRTTPEQKEAINTEQLQNEAAYTNTLYNPQEKIAWGEDSLTNNIVDRYAQHLKVAEPGRYNYLIGKKQAGDMTEEDMATLNEGAINHAAVLLHSEGVKITEHLGPLPPVPHPPVAPDLKAIELFKQQAQEYTEAVDRHKEALRPLFEMQDDLSDYAADYMKQYPEYAKKLVEDQEEQAKADKAWEEGIGLADIGMLSTAPLSYMVKDAYEILGGETTPTIVEMAIKSPVDRAISSSLSGMLTLPRTLGGEGYGWTDYFGDQIDALEESYNMKFAPQPMAFEKGLAEGVLEGNIKESTDLIVPKVMRTASDMVLLVAGTKGFGGGLKKLGAGSATQIRSGIIASSFVNLHNRYYQEGVGAGLSPDDAKWFALQSGAIVGLLEAVNPQMYLFRGAGTKVLLNRFIENLGTGVSRKAALSSALKFTAKQVGFENFEEFSQMAGEKYIKHLTNKQVGKHVFDTDFNMGEVVETAFLTSIISAFTGGIGAGKASRATTETAYLATRNLAQTKDLITKAVERGTLTEEQAQNIIRQIEGLKPKVDAIPDNYTEEEKSELSYLYLEQDRVRENYEAADVGFKPKYQKQLDKITDQINNIVKTKEDGLQGETQEEAVSETQEEGTQEEVDFIGVPNEVLDELNALNVVTEESITEVQKRENLSDEQADRLREAYLRPTEEVGQTERATEEVNRVIDAAENEIRHYAQQRDEATTPEDKAYFDGLIDKRLQDIDELGGPLRDPAESYVGQYVRYQGVDGYLQKDNDGNLVVLSNDGNVTFVEGGLSGVPAGDIGIFGITAPAVEGVVEGDTPTDTGVSFDGPSNTMTVYGNTYTYDGVEVDTDGNTTAIRAVDQNGETKLIRNQDAILEVEIQKEIFENANATNWEAADIQSAAEQTGVEQEPEVTPEEARSRRIAEIQQRKPTEDTTDLKSIEGTTQTQEVRPEGKPEVTQEVVPEVTQEVTEEQQTTLDKLDNLKISEENISRLEGMGGTASLLGLSAKGWNKIIDGLKAAVVAKKNLQTAISEAIISVKKIEADWWNNLTSKQKQEFRDKLTEKVAPSFEAQEEAPRQKKPKPTRSPEAAVADFGTTAEQNANKARERKRSAYNRFMERVFDSQYDLIKAISSLSDLGKIANAYLVTIHGANAVADKMIEDVVGAVFPGLSNKKKYEFNGIKISMRGLFDAVLQARRVIAVSQKINDKFNRLLDIDTEITTLGEQAAQLHTPSKKLEAELAALKKEKSNIKTYLDRNGVLGKDKDGNYQLGERTFTKGTTEAESQAVLDEIKNKYPKVYQKISTKADVYMEAFNTQLAMLRDEGLLSQEAYEDLTRYDYIPMQNIAYIIEDLFSGLKPSQRAKGSQLIKKLQEGSEENISVAWEDLMSLQIRATQHRIYKNRAARKIANAVKENPDNTFFREAKIVGYDGNGNPQYEKTKPDEEYISYYKENGQEERLIADRVLVGQWNNTNQLGWGRAEEHIQRWTGVELFKNIITNENPAFGLAQLAMDMPQAILASDAYSTFTSGSPKLAYQYGKFALDVAMNPKGRRDTKVRRLYEEARAAGALTSFTRDVDDRVSVGKRKGVLTAPFGRAGKKVRGAIGTFNSAMEYGTRLAVYEQKRDNLIKEYKKSEGKDPSGEDLRDIQVMAAAETRGLLDYARGGTLVKAANRYLVYLNPAVQAFYSQAKNWKKDPVKAATKLLETPVLGVGLLAASVMALSDDDEEGFKKAYERMSEYERRTYAHILDVYKYQTTGEIGFIRLGRKPDIAKPLMNMVETIYMNMAHDTDYNVMNESGMSTVEALPLKNVLSSNPLGSAVLKGILNVDPYRMKQVVRDEERIPNYMEGIDDPNVGAFYKYLGEKVRDLETAGVEVGEYYSPKRAEAAVKSYVGDYERNPATSIPLKLLGEAISLISPDYKEKTSSEEKTAADNFLEWSGFSTVTNRFATKLGKYPPEYYEALNEANEEKWFRSHDTRTGLQSIIDNKNLSDEQKRKEANNFLNNYEYKEKKLTDRQKQYYGRYYNNRKYLNEKSEWVKDLSFADNKELALIVWDSSSGNLNKDEQKKLIFEMYNNKALNAGTYNEILKKINQ